MRIPLTLAFLVAIACPLIDIYIYKVLGRLGSRRRLMRTLHIIFAIAAYAMLVTAMCMPRRGGDGSELLAIMWMLFAFISIYIPKFLFVIIDLLGSIPCLFRRSRLRHSGAIAASLAVILFGGMWYGALVNRFRTQVVSQEIFVNDLPEAFDGYTIAQISDLHTGTFGSDTSFVASLVDRVNSLHPDLIAFTGDIVNRRSDEMLPHMAPLSRLNAPDGVMSILGNHDYGDYYDWPSPADKAANMELLYSSMDSIGWDLLRNEHRAIIRGRDSIMVIGVENIGDPPFPVYGSLDEAYPAGADGTTKILLSHNPAHWLDEIADGKKPNDIDLTLSGHTHAMQMELLGLSPAVWRYPAWGGLNSDDQGRNLYVNIGAGTVGLPMRIGATPEITLLTLRRRR